jgi:hypothetical protein
MSAQNFAEHTMNLLIIAHSPLGAAYAELLRHIFPENTLPPVHVLDIAPHEGHAAIIARAQAELDTHKAKGGTLILSDLFGATPCNAAAKLLHTGNTALISGLNAPMLLKAATHARHTASPADLAETVKQAGIRGIHILAETDFQAA